MAGQLRRSLGAHAPPPMAAAGHRERRRGTTLQAPDSRLELGSESESPNRADRLPWPNAAGPCSPGQARGPSSPARDAEPVPLSEARLEASHLGGAGDPSGPGRFVLNPVPPFIRVDTGRSWALFEDSPRCASARNWLAMGLQRCAPGCRWRTREVADECCVAPPSIASISDLEACRRWYWVVRGPHDPPILRCFVIAAIRREASFARRPALEPPSPVGPRSGRALSRRGLLEAARSYD